jgi:peptide/nickel transport system permease protein
MTSLWQAILQRLWQRAAARRACYGLLCFLFVAIFSDFLANEKPVLGNFSAIIPYSAHTIDLKNAGFISPFGSQAAASLHFRHWLGTDNLGRDVTAGLIAGTRTAVLVGFGAAFFVIYIGVLVGLLAGFFGNEGIKSSLFGYFLMVTTGFLAFFYAFQARWYALQVGDFWEIWKSILLFLTILISGFSVIYWIENRVKMRRFSIPLDAFLTNFIEIISTIPTLFFVVALTVLFKKPSLLNIVLLIGLTSWTGIAWLVRAEAMKIRATDFAEAGRAMGLPTSKMLKDYFLPNILPVLSVQVAFVVASAILMESFLSFVGVGVAADAVTWGAMLGQAEDHFSAWWMAIFPGMMLFFMILCLHIIGETLAEVVRIK